MAKKTALALCVVFLAAVFSAAQTQTLTVGQTRATTRYGYISVGTDGSSEWRTIMNATNNSDTARSYVYKYRAADGKDLFLKESLANGVVLPSNPSGAQALQGRHQVSEMLTAPDGQFLAGPVSGWVELQNIPEVWDGDAWIPLITFGMRYQSVSENGMVIASAGMGTVLPSASWNVDVSIGPNSDVGVSILLPFTARSPVTIAVMLFDNFGSMGSNGKRLPSATATVQLSPGQQWTGLLSALFAKDEYVQNRLRDGKTLNQASVLIRDQAQLESVVVNASLAADRAKDGSAWTISGGSVSTAK